MDLLKLIIYLLAFGGLSWGSSLIVNTISSFTKLLRVPPFIFSFFIVGLLTSVGEIAVAVNAVSIHKPEIFVGSMLGGTLVIFLLVMPLMTLLTGGLPIKRHLGVPKLLITLAVIATPALFTLDHVVTKLEAAALVILYIGLFFMIKSPVPSLQRADRALHKQAFGWRQNSLLRLGFGTALIFLSSRYIVEQTLVYAHSFNVSAFMVGLIVIAIGTNLPEFALAVRAASSHELKAEDIAVGDFLGSAAANVVLFGIFTLINGGDVVTGKNFTTTFLCIMLALVAFFAFTRGKSILTVKESLVLIGVYLLFVGAQFMAE